MQNCNLLMGGNSVGIRSQPLKRVRLCREDKSLGYQAMHALPVRDISGSGMQSTVVEKAGGDEQDFA